jgi:hypothetical protein
MIPMYRMSAEPAAWQNRSPSNDFVICGVGRA